MNKTWIPAVALALALTACVRDTPRGQEQTLAGSPGLTGAAAQFAKARPDCPTSMTECVLTVKVGPRCTIQVLPKELYVVAPHPGGVDMIWNIDGDATFPKDGGIKFQSSDFKPLKKQYQEYPISSPKGVFIPSKVKAASDKQERLRNQSKPGLYYYTIEVVQGGTNCPPYDPGVVDQ